MKVYIAGKITDNPKYKEQFRRAETRLRRKGHITMNPAILPPGFEWHEYMGICFSMIDVCEGVYFLNNWFDSKGANMEHRYALRKGKTLMYQRVSQVKGRG